MKKTSYYLNVASFILAFNLMVMLVLFGIFTVSLSQQVDSLNSKIDKATEAIRRCNDNFPTIHLIEFADNSLPASPSGGVVALPPSGKSKRSEAPGAPASSPPSTRGENKRTAAPIAQATDKGAAGDSGAVPLGMYFAVSLFAISVLFLVRSIIGKGMVKVVRLSAP